MQIAALVLSILAFIVSGLTARQQLVLARHSNAVPVLVDLFREHRGVRLAKARNFVWTRLREYDLERGLDALPDEDQELVRELAWFYDNLGALVAHNIVDLAPVSGYLGGAVQTVWECMEPLVYAERKRRQGHDPRRWQEYFENLYYLVREDPPEKARAAQRRWRLGSEAREVRPSAV